MIQHIQHHNTHDTYHVDTDTLWSFFQAFGVFLLGLFTVHIATTVGVLASTMGFVYMSYQLYAKRREHAKQMRLYDLQIKALEAETYGHEHFYPPENRKKYHATRSGKNIHR